MKGASISVKIGRDAKQNGKVSFRVKAFENDVHKCFCVTSHCHTYQRQLSESNCVWKLPGGEVVDCPSQDQK